VKYLRVAAPGSLVFTCVHGLYVDEKNKNKRRKKNSDLFQFAIDVKVCHGGRKNLPKYILFKKLCICNGCLSVSQQVQISPKRKSFVVMNDK